MKFDWSMVKGVRSDSGYRPPEPRPAPASPVRRFPSANNGFPVLAEVGVPLLDFITWCVPDDGSKLSGPIGRLYESLEDSDVPQGEQSTPRPR